ncbi:uncharacterized protein PV09_05178 [Verruconis gallopava]|uniref:Alpha/beta hydrolase fold-3 domain-containing protein n=1 Tax=Verruconis gallopava TaxID=253628 RepID=A0A0D2ABD8_9PEZI|nr:uncharacterized protein PV09_05178 [Verruconis gallopava]KIW03885.1 hypothetical protein PV09_05178 [Verruconis gallopava]
MAGQDIKDLAKIDPEFEAFLKTLPVVPQLRGDIPTLRKQLSEAKRKQQAAAGLVETPLDIKEEDITVTARDGYLIPVRTYKPKDPPEGGSPLIVLYHGGGFCLGDLQNEELNCRNFVKDLGAVCVNVDYRLAPEYKFPTALNDSWDVLQWAARNASSLGADTSQGFILFGTQPERAYPLFLAISLVTLPYHHLSQVSPHRSHSCSTFVILQLSLGPT